MSSTWLTAEYSESRCEKISVKTRDAVESELNSDLRWKHSGLLTSNFGLKILCKLALLFTEELTNTTKNKVQGSLGKIHIGVYNLDFL